MHHSFWHQRWRNGEIGFHEAQPNPLLVRHFSSLNLPAGAQVFVPLCGKSHDIHWLLSRNYSVTGAELSEIAIQQLFDELGIRPDIEALAAQKKYTAPGLQIFVGDLFSLRPEQLDEVAAVYDRAALVALPADMRKLYATHLVELTRGAPQLLISFNYNPTAHQGPPFAVDREELQRLYANTYRLQLLEDAAVAGGLKGTTPAREQVWHLAPPIYSSTGRLPGRPPR